MISLRQPDAAVGNLAPEGGEVMAEVLSTVALALAVGREAILLAKVIIDFAKQNRCS